MAERVNKRDAQRGAALVIVLLLVATLSFIVLALARQTALASARSGGAGARAEMSWRAVGAEAFALSAVKAANKAGEAFFTQESALFATPQELPVEDGSIELRFADRTACFNINSLVARNDSGHAELNKAAKSEFMALARFLGLSDGESDRIAAVVVDWLDDDGRIESGGAEDGFYTALPAPYRTGGVLLADVSELRAMSGITPELFKTISPWLCAYPETTPARVNVNLLEPVQAPVLAALSGGRLLLADARAVIESRPPGGWRTEEEFWSAAALKTEESTDDIHARIALTSRYIEARIRLESGPLNRTVALLLQLDDGKARLVSRRFGALA